MQDADEKFREKMLRKIDVIMKLMAAEAVRGKSLREQIQFLDSLGLQPIEIADILGKSSNHIRVELVHIRKGRGGKNG